jgi:hypothetical protein
MNTYRMAITPRAIQELFDELEASRQSRRRAWEILQRFRAMLDNLGPNSVPLPAARTIDAEGAVLERALLDCLKKHKAALATLASAARRFRDAVAKPDYPHALQSLLVALDLAESLLE